MKHIFKDAFLDESAISGEVNNNIKKYRMGDFFIEFPELNSENIEKVDVSQTGHYFKFGCSTFMIGGYDTEEKNKAFEESFLNLFNLGVVGTFWKDYEPKKGVYRFDKDSQYIYRRPPVDTALKFCRDNGISAKAHNLIWHQKTMQPDWLDSDRTKIMPDIENYIEEVGKRYGDKFDYVDVVNEHLCRGPYKSEKWDPSEAIMPQDYAAKAFDKAAKCFDKKTKLMTNENHMPCWVEYRHDSSSYYLYLKYLLESGRRVDAIGMQYHAFVSDVHEEWFGLNMFRVEALYTMLMLYNSFGLPMHLSEITIPSSLFGEPVDEELQARIADSFYRMWFSIPNMEAIVWWNLTDGAAYQNEDDYKGALLRSDFSKKPAYKALDNLINKEWKTKEILYPVNGKCSFRGFYGKYQITVKTNKGSHIYNCEFTPEKKKYSLKSEC